MTRLIHCLLLFSLLPLNLSAQSEKPKLGLVLSGGGARGLAHIGVIRVLEEEGIYPDYITGTSMGALVGALYSIGYTPDEMEQIIEEANWDELLSNSIPLNEVTIEEKEFYGRFIAELAIKGWKVELPQGLIEGQHLNELFSRLTRSVHDINDFNKFPIPFACVAADISTGERVVLDRGFLPEAMRASMAIPSVFTPVEIDGRLLVDGGLVRNLPVDEVKAMGADVVIAVNVSMGLKPKEELIDMVELLSQSAFLLGERDARDQVKKAGLVINPNLKEFNVSDFKKGGEIVAAGEQTARRMLDSIKNFKKEFLIDGEMKEAEKLPQKDLFNIKKVLVEGNSKIEAEYILGKLNIEENQKLSIDEIAERINLLFGTRYFSKIGYSLQNQEDGNTLTVKVKELPQRKLKFAIHYDTENQVGANFNLTFRNVLLKNSRVISEFDIADNPRMHLSYFKYLGVKQKSAWNLGLDWANLPLPLYESDGAQRALFATNYFNYHFLWQSTNHQHFNFGIQYKHEFTNLKPKVVDPILGSINRLEIRTHGAGVFYRLNTLNRPFFPLRGWTVLVSGDYNFGVYNRAEVNPIEPGDNFEEVDLNEDNYVDVKLNFDKYQMMGERSVLSFSGSLVYSDLPLNTFNLTGYEFIGGFNPRYIHAQSFYGASDKEYYATSYAYLRLMYQYELFYDFYLQAIVNYIDSEYPMELMGLDYDQTSFSGEDRRIGYGLSAGYLTKMGPLLVSTGIDPTKKEWHTYLSLGFWF